MPQPLTVSAFLVPAHPGSPGKRAVKLVCVYVVYARLWLTWTHLVYHGCVKRACCWLLMQSEGVAGQRRATFSAVRRLLMHTARGERLLKLWHAMSRCKAKQVAAVMVATGSITSAARTSATPSSSFDTFFSGLSFQQALDQDSGIAGEGCVWGSVVWVPFPDTTEWFMRFA